jgi:hypothetical protein
MKKIGIILETNQNNYGTLITIFLFLILLLNSNYFYHTNSTKKGLKK